MSELLSESQTRILRALLAERENLANDLSPRAVHSRAFGMDTKVGRTKEQLGRLGWRGLVEESARGEWRITDAGAEAMQDVAA